MAYNFIIKYKILKPTNRPIGGKDKLLKICDDLETAKEWVKENYSMDDDIAIFEVRYASEENLKKDFHYDSHLRWATYI